MGIDPLVFLMDECFATHNGVAPPFFVQGELELDCHLTRRPPQSNHGSPRARFHVQELDVRVVHKACPFQAQLDFSIPIQVTAGPPAFVVG